MYVECQYDTPPTTGAQASDSVALHHLADVPNCQERSLTLKCALIMRPTFFPRLLLCVVVLLTTGCSRSLLYISDVDSIALSDQSVGRRYLLLPGNQGSTPDDLEFLEYARYVETVLTPLGFSKASTEQDADIAIFLSYGVGAPETHQVTSSSPVYGQTGVSSATTSGTIMPLGGGMASYSDNTTYTPQYGVTGYQTHSHSYTTYTRSLQLIAYDVAAYRHEKKQRQVLKTSVVSTGSSGDLRLVLPYMITAMKPYLAGNTGRSIRIELKEDDPTVTVLRGKSPKDGK